MLYRSVLLLLTWAVTVKSQEPTMIPTMIPSDMPSDVPSDIPSFVPSFVEESAMPSSLPTILHDICYICGEGNVVSDPNGRLLQYTCDQAELAGLAGKISPSDCQLVQSNAGAPAQCNCVPAPEFECNTNTCTFYSSMTQLKQAAAVRSDICMCSTAFRPNSMESCTGTSQDTITIDEGRDVRIECVDSNLECRLECPNTAFAVRGSLTLEGNGRMKLGNGETESRIYVAPTGSFTMNQVRIVETKAVIPNDEVADNSRRRLQYDSGKGAGVYNEGSMKINDCSFRNNTAELNGGAIYTTTGDAVIESTAFQYNEGLTGGAIYVESGTITVKDSSFDGNTVTGDNEYEHIFVSESATLEGCGNAGLGDDLSTACPQSTAVAWTISNIWTGALLLLWTVL